MARNRNSAVLDEAEVTEASVPEQASEASVEVQPEATEAEATEATEVQLEAEAPASDTASTESEIDLSAFQTAATDAVELRDQSTGDLPTTAIDAVATQYRALEGIKAKNRAKGYLGDQMKEAMNSLNLPLARAFMQLQNEATVAATTSTSTKREATPADPGLDAAQRVASLRLATSLVEVPEGYDVEAKVDELLSGDPVASAKAYLAWESNEAEDKGDAPEVSPVVLAAIKASRGKGVSIKRTSASTGTGHVFTGERRNVATHIQSAFADAESGTFLTIAQIKAHRSEEYGDDSPSPGAISARLFPKNGKIGSGLEGIVPAEVDGKRGARKA
jgi:hypothetical protein